MTCSSICCSPRSGSKKPDHQIVHTDLTSKRAETSLDKSILNRHQKSFVAGHIRWGAFAIPQTPSMHRLGRVRMNG